ncbi:hypothetical protein BH23ACT5_BH23ACT5_06500 [soil metagenome]
MAGGVWSTAVAARWWGVAGVVAVCVPVVVVSLVVSDRRTLGALLLLMVAGGWSGLQSVAREEAVLGYQTVAVEGETGIRLTTDPRQGRYGWWALAVSDPPEQGRPPGIPLLVTFESDPGVIAGEWLLVDGRRTGRSGRAGGRLYSGVVTAAEVVDSGAERGPWWVAGNAVRRRALDPLSDAGPHRALLAGFLVGDTSGLAQQTSMPSAAPG